MARPGMSSIHPFYENGGNVVAISHAGVTSGGAKAGSLDAYLAARELGFRYFQIDVIKVGAELVSHHAVWGRRIGWEPKTVDGLRAAGHVVERVADIVEAIPDGRWNLEIKNRKAEQPLIEYLRTQEDVVHRFGVSAPFHRRLLGRLRAEFGNELCTNASLLEGSLIGVPLIPQRVQHADAMQVLFPLVRSRRVIDLCRAKGIQFQAWPVNGREAMERLLDVGVRGIITDDHELLREVLIERDEWEKT